MPLVRSLGFQARPKTLLDLNVDPSAIVSRNCHVINYYPPHWVLGSCVQCLFLPEHFVQAVAADKKLSQLKGNIDVLEVVACPATETAASTGRH